jgi:hypothetical protein
LLLLLSVLSGILLSKPSLVGSIGINLFYKQYKFLKVWWQGALTVFAVWMLLYWIQTFLQKRYADHSRWIQLLAILLSLAGLYFTYADFRHTTTHRWLGERFHIGAYLFWLGWIGISLYLLTESRPNVLPANPEPVEP